MHGYRQSWVLEPKFNLPSHAMGGIRWKMNGDIRMYHGRGEGRMHMSSLPVSFPLSFLLSFKEEMLTEGCLSALC